ncbi:MAG: hypothetical protein PHV59_09645 [Victivallales bacterium]|nr:hypothetical protein [Victivallales bacterium]
MIQIFVKNRTALGSFELNLRVFSFVLDLPYYTSNIYYSGFLSDKYPDGTISSEAKSEQQLEAEFKNMYEHGVLNPICCQTFKNRKLFRKYFKSREKAGIQANTLYSCCGIGNLTCNDTPAGKAALKKRIEDVLEYLKNLKETDIMELDLDGMRLKIAEYITGLQK